MRKSVAKVYVSSCYIGYSDFLPGAHRWSNTFYSFSEAAEIFFETFGCPALFVSAQACGEGSSRIAFPSSWHIRTSRITARYVLYTNGQLWISPIQLELLTTTVTCGETEDLAARAMPKHLSSLKA